MTSYGTFLFKYIQERTILKRYTLAIFFILASTMLAASPEGNQSIFDFWQTQGLQEISLYLDLEEMERNRRSENKMDGQLMAGEQTFDITYEVGGRFRRANCEMPPLRLHLNKKRLVNLGFNKNNDFKLVTHCNNDPGAEDALLREALVYELYRQLSPAMAYRSQVVKINYINTADDSHKSAYGLLIEDTDELKARTALRTIENAYNLPLKNIDNAEIVTLFQYLVGNADFSLIMQRNVKLLEDKQGRITILPYDFDYSGLVSPAYAQGDPTKGQRSIKDRVWVWEYNSEPQMKEARRLFLDKRRQLLDTVENFPLLNEESKKEVSRYIREFYTELRAGLIGTEDMK